MKPLLILIICACTSFVYGQDSITFQNRQNHSKLINLPIDEFPVIMDIHKLGRVKAYITSIKTDSTTLKVYTYEKSKALRDSIKSISEDTILTSSEKEILIR